MSIVINREQCTGCGKCRDICPGDLLCGDDAGKTYIRHPEECWGCTACVKECAVQAIHYYLGADIGGRGSFLYTRRDRQRNRTYWIFVGPKGQERILKVDGNKANSY